MAVHVEVVVVHVTHLVIVRLMRVKRGGFSLSAGGRLELCGDECTKEAAVEGRGMEGVGGDVVEHVCDVFHQLKRLLFIIQERLEFWAN